MIRFVDIIARTLPASRLKEIAEAMLLNDDETYLLMERCSKLKTVEQCPNVSPRRQREIMPILNTKFQLWVLQALDERPTGFFSAREEQALCKALSEHKKKK